MVHTLFVRSFVSSFFTSEQCFFSMFIHRKPTRRVGERSFARSLAPAIVLLFEDLVSSVFFVIHDTNNKLDDDWFAKRCTSRHRNFSEHARNVSNLSPQIVADFYDIFVRMQPNVMSLLRMSRAFSLTRGLNCWTAAITKKHRRVYERTYPTVLVQPDGSAIRIQYHEPRKIVTLPLDVNTLSETERKARIERRKPRSRVKIVEDIEDDFDENRYLKFAKR